MKKRKNKKLFKSKRQMIIYILLYIICIGLFIVIGKTDYKKDKPSDSLKFSNLYSLVPENNLYVFSNANDVLDILNGRSGVIFMSFPSNKWSNNYAYLLNKACMYVGIDKIYYYNFLSDRDNNNGTYQTIVRKLDNYINVLDEDDKDIYAPTVILVKDGKVINYIDDLSITKGNMDVEEYYKLNENIIYSNLLNSLEEYYGK